MQALFAMEQLWRSFWGLLFPAQKEPYSRVPDPVENHVYVFQVNGNEKLSSFSPPCIKLAHWLRMANVPHTLMDTFPPTPGPTGKFPYVELNGETIGDSSHIIDRLEAAFRKDLDAGLSSEEKALALAVQRMIEEHLYFIELHYRWQVDEYFDRTIKAYTAGYPGKAILLVKMFRSVGVAQVKGQVGQPLSFLRPHLFCCKPWCLLATHASAVETEQRNSR